MSGILAIQKASGGVLNVTSTDGVDNTEVVFPESGKLATESYVDSKEVPIATTVEAQAGNDDTKAITPLKLRQGLNASGAAPIYACRAWVNFNGTGTVAIRASGNVSSITDNGVGYYTVNFTTPMSDANYSVATSHNYLESQINPHDILVINNQTSSMFRVGGGYYNGYVNFRDQENIGLVVFR